MGCGTCGVSKSKDGSPGGCQSKGHCKTGGCNRLNTYNWLADLPSSGERDSFNIVEVSFKNGSTKAFFKNNLNSFVITGDDVVVETNYGFHLGRVSLSGELVRLQMKKKRVKEDSEKITRVLRIATESDLEKALYYASMEREVMTKARVIARDLGLAMKIGDVEYQADGRKIIFYYTADARVDFRELIKIFAREFRVRVEMMQIGPRQEAGKIGGIGSCGRELCCSTWLSDFKPVQTNVARYQNLSVNQTKLSGQCGRLKCCLNFELDSYLDALKDFPKQANYLKLKDCEARLVKTDIFKRKMWYGIPNSPLVMLDVERVKEIQEMNANGEQPESLVDPKTILREREALLEDLSDYSNTVEQIDLPDLKKKKKRRNNRNKKSNNSNRRKTNNPKSDKQSDSKRKQSLSRNKNTPNSKKANPEEGQKNTGRNPKSGGENRNKGDKKPNQDAQKKSQNRTNSNKNTKRPNSQDRNKNQKPSNQQSDQKRPPKSSGKPQNKTNDNKDRSKDDE